MKITKMAVAALLGVVAAQANAQSFTAGNIVVYQSGDGTAYTSGNSAPVLLKEYAPAGGAAVTTLTLPVTGGARLTASSSATSEGQMTRSADGFHLVIPGYDVASNTASVNGTTNNRIIDTVGNSRVAGRAAAGTATSFAGDNFRGAAKAAGTDDYWTTGNAANNSNRGIWYFGNTAVDAQVHNSTFSNTRAVNVFNGNLYGTTSTDFFQVGTGLPKTANTTATSLLAPSGASLYAFSINPAGNVAFLADDGTGGIRKLTKTGNTWSQAYQISGTGSRGLTVDWSNAAANGSGAIIYYTTNLTGAGNALRRVTDNNSAAGSSNTLIATAPTNTTFRGVALAPIAQCVPSVTIQSDDANNSICTGTAITFSIASSSNLGTTPTYQWTVNGSNIPNATNNTYTSSALADDNEIGLIVTSNAACAVNNASTVSNLINVEVNAPVTPTIGISNPAIICYLSQSTFTATGTSLGSAATYTWRRNGNVVANTNGNEYVTSDISVYKPDTIVVTVSNINQACATASTINDTVIVQAVGTPNPAVVASGSRIFCDGGSVTLSNDINAGNTDYTFVWTKDGSTVGSNYNYTATESGTYQLMITNANGCVRNSAPQVVTEKPNPVVNAVANGSLAICPGSSVSLTTDSVAGYSIRWRRDDATNVSTASAYVAKIAGSYTARVTLNGCTVVSAPLNVTVKTTDVTLTVGGPATFCSGGSVTLNAANNTGYTYQWYNSTTPISNATNASYIATTSGSYKVAISNDGCLAKNSATTKVTVNPTPAATITQTAITATSATLRGNNGTVYTYQWYLDGNVIPSATNQVYTATQDGAYTLGVTRNGCTGISDPFFVTLTTPARRGVEVASNNITVYPNPSEGVFKIGAQEPVNVIVKDVQGRTVAEVKNAAHIDMSNQPAGMYIMLISDLNGKLLQVERVTKK